MSNLVPLFNLSMLEIEKMAVLQNMNNLIPLFNLSMLESIEKMADFSTYQCWKA